MYLYRIYTILYMKQMHFINCIPFENQTEPRKKLGTQPESTRVSPCCTQVGNLQIRLEFGFGLEMFWLHSSQV